jgi:hypothetical protein
MPLPQVIANNLSPIGPLPATPLAVAPPPPPGPAPPAPPPPPPPPPFPNPLNFVMSHQQEQNWCWAAVALTITRYYNTTSIWISQCQIASSGLGFICCQVGQNCKDCDVPWRLDSALNVTNNFNTWAPGQASISQIAVEIDGGKPLGVRIGWPDGTGHFCCITGYWEVGGETWLHIEDPCYKHTCLSYSHFRSHYHCDGTWTDSYWTKP